jgi:hypothetical protein
MIISHRHKFIFIKTRKTGGTALEIALSRYLGENDIVTPISPEDEAKRSSSEYVSCQNFLQAVPAINEHNVKGAAKAVLYANPTRYWPKQFYNHMPAHEVRRKVSSEVWNTYFKFSIERNPFDLAVSYYTYQQRKQKNHDFRDFVLSGRSKRGSNYGLYTIDGHLAVDSLLLYERLYTGLSYISEKIGLPENLGDVMQTQSAKSQYRHDRAYRQYYDGETKWLIERQFGREMALLDYTF